MALTEEKPPFVPNVAAPVVRPPARPVSPLTKLFETPVFLKMGRKRIQAKIVGVDRSSSGMLRRLSIGLPEKLDARVKVEGVEVVDGAGNVLAVIERRTDDMSVGMQEILSAIPTDATAAPP